jgi:2-polyprenylphenol 6-hydroxylase
MSVTQTTFDVAIVGAGLVGAALALALRDTGLSVALLDARAPQPLPQDASWDSRVYAISPGSVAFLDALGVWADLPRARLTQVEAMRIFGDDALSELDFSAYDVGHAALAWIVESRLLQEALWQALQAAPHVSLRVPAEPAALTIDAQSAQITLASGEALHARLVVAADGARSWARAQAGIEAHDKDYDQLGVVANFATERAHGGTAFQWFQPEGVLAYLPLPGNQISMVWSLQTALAQELMALPPQTLCERVAQASGQRLGKLELITPPAAFPLHLIEPRQLTKPRVALVGDAAHQVHPLAGQGVNLGFGDAQALAQALRTRGPRDCGDVLLLRGYERARREEILAMALVTDGLQGLFNRTGSGLGWLRNIGLTLTNRAGWLKNQLIKHALGAH